MQATHSTARLFFSFVLLNFLLTAHCRGQQEQDFLVRPIDGSRMVVGDGDVPDYTIDCFLYLCDNAFPNVVVIDLDSPPSVTPGRFKDRGAASVLMLDSLPNNFESLTLSLLNANGIWIEGNPEKIAKHPMMLPLLKNVTKRNGVVAVNSSSVPLLEQLDENDQEKQLQSPFATCEFHFGAGEVAQRKNQDSHRKVHWLIPDEAALVVHRGRQIAGYGQQDIRVLVQAANGWPERNRTFECIDVFGPGGYPSYSLDLLSWIRSAKDRGRTAFQRVAESPVLENGTLFLHGGSRLQPDVLEKFVKIAGGKESAFVCIPSAQKFDRFEEPDSYSAGSLNEMGCSNVTVLHTSDPLVANQSSEFARILKNADGVWIDGGRTFRFMDCYEGTQIPRLLEEVLQRGGVVGGSSAGCQVPSDFLVRGNPTSNRDIEFGGYTRGMKLLKGVVIDAHFLQRERHQPFLALMKKYPQMLGIGIDESTALIVKGHQARVIGEAAVSFYDLASGPEEDFEPVILSAGETYDLRAKKAVK